MVPLFIGQCSEERAEPEGVVNGPVATSGTTQIEHFEITSTGSIFFASFASLRDNPK
jgi:hypothetical protein